MFLAIDLVKPSLSTFLYNIRAPTIALSAQDFSGLLGFFPDESMAGNLLTRVEGLEIAFCSNHLADLPLSSAVQTMKPSIILRPH